MKLPSRSETDLRKIIDAIYAVAERRWVVLAASAVAVSVSATTSEEMLASVRVPAKAMGANGILRVSSLWVITNSANNKTVRVRLGGIGGTAYMANTLTTNAFYNDQRRIHNVNSESSQKGGPSGSTVFGSGTTAPITSSIDTTADTTIVFTGQKADSSETITLASYLVELYTAG